LFIFGIAGDLLNYVVNSINTSKNRLGLNF